MSSPASIDMTQLLLVKSIFMLNTNYQSPDDRVSIGISLKNNGEFKDDGTGATFTQHLTTTPPTNAPFFLDVEFNAKFFLDPAPLPLEYVHYVRRIFPKIVFPYLREYVAETTRRGGLTPLLLSYNIFNEGIDREGLAPTTTAEMLH